MRPSPALLCAVCCSSREWVETKFHHHGYPVEGQGCCGDGCWRVSEESHREEWPIEPTIQDLDGNGCQAEEGLVVVG